MADLIAGLSPLPIRFSCSLAHSVLATASLLCAAPRFEGLGDWLRETRARLPVELCGELCTLIGFPGRHQRFDLPVDIRRGEGTLAFIIEDGGVVETASKTIPILLQTVDLTMYPEGGELVAGLPWAFEVAVEAPAEAEDGPGPATISKYVAPRALLWFRWGALVTWLTGAAFLLHKGQLHNAFMLGLNADPVNQYAMTIGVGAWLGTIMLFNVWVLIWPNQKKVLGMVDASADEVARAKNIAFLASRSNTLMSIPMIMSMIGAGHGWFM